MFGPIPRLNNKELVYSHILGNWVMLKNDISCHKKKPVFHIGVKAGDIMSFTTLT